MAVQGLRGTGQFLAAERPENWREGILRLWPNGKAPLVGLTSAMRKKPTDDPKFHWFEKRFPIQRLQLAAGLIGAGTPLTFVNAAEVEQVKRDHILLIEETGELVRATADGNGAAETLAVTRSFGNVTAGGGNDFNPAVAGKNPFVTVIGNMAEEGAKSGTPVSYLPQEFNNFTQIFRNPLSLSRTAMNTRLRTKEQVSESKRETLELHSVEIERAFLWGESSEAVGTGGLFERTTQGVIRYIKSYTTFTRSKDYAGINFDIAALDNLMYEIFLYGSTEKFAFVGNRALLNINQTIRKTTGVQYQIAGAKEFGMNVQRLTSPFGDLVLKTHPLMNVMSDGDNPTAGGAYTGWNQALIALDMEHIIYRPLKNSDTRYKPDIGENDLDGMKSEYLTEAGLELHFPEAHYVAEGIDTPA